MSEGFFSPLLGYLSLVLCYAYLPVLLLSLALGAKFIRPINQPVLVKFDKISYGLLAIGFTAFVYATEQSGTHGWFAAIVLTLLGIAALCLGVFVIRSLQQSSPLLNLLVFRNIGFTLALLFILFGQFNVLSLGYLIPNYSQLVSGSSTFIAGLLLLPGCLIGALIAPVAGRLYDRLGARKPIILGSAILMISTALFAIFAKQLSTVVIMLIYALFAVGQGLAVGNSMTFGLSRLSLEQSADGNAVINTLQQLSGAVGTSVAASFIAAAQSNSASLAQATLQGSRNAFALISIFATLALILIYIALKNHSQK